MRIEVYSTLNHADRNSQFYWQYYRLIPASTNLKKLVTVGFLAEIRMHLYLISRYYFKFLALIVLQFCIIHLCRNTLRTAHSVA